MKKSKKLLSFFLSIIMILYSLGPIGMTASAQTYRNSLKKKGFPDSYISYLVDLHKKYPNWTFEPFKTGLNWQTAINGERSSHSKQQIRKSSSRSTDYYCTCSKCYKNGRYTYHSGSLVNASEGAVKYYMDPRNWMNEKYIFQFESTSYNKKQNTSGVEAILKGTWMHNSYITYYNTTGKKITYKKNGKKVKYSTAIMDAAKYSNLSAYYIASKIVQEVGSTKPNVGGTCGTRLPFKGIYNYYSIGASSTASNGLEWASGYLKTTKKTTLYASYDSKKKKGTGKKKTVKNGQYMCYISSAGEYYRVRLYNYSHGSYSKDGAVGYIKKSALRTQYFNYNRPWTNPYVSIVYGAKYIANSYSKHQNTLYLQKYNVNKKSGSLYGHEYLVNVNGPSENSVTNYNAYKSAGILKSHRVFYIPVFKNMPSAPCKPSDSSDLINIKTSSTKTTVSLSWNKIKTASGYYVYQYDSSKKKYKKIATLNKNSKTSYKIEKLSSGKSYKFAVRYYKKSGKKIKNGKLVETTVPTKPGKTVIVNPVTNSKHQIIVKWKAQKDCSGYQVQYSKKENFSTIIATREVDSRTGTSYTGRNFVKGRRYYVRVRAYKSAGGKRAYSSWSDTKTIKSK